MSEKTSSSKRSREDTDPGKDSWVADQPLEVFVGSDEEAIDPIDL